jgi:hypothetical protein
VEVEPAASTFPGRRRLRCRTVSAARPRPPGTPNSATALIQAKRYSVTTVPSTFARNSPLVAPW